MSLAFPSPEFDHAVVAVCHGSATDEQVRALNALLRSHPAARDEYILRVELHSRLASDPDLFASETADPISTSKNVLPLPPARRIPQSSWLLALAACVALLLTGLWWVNRAEPGARQGDTSKAVAMLNRVADAVWEQHGENPRLGAPLEPGWLRLKSGLVQIVFYSGARLVIEGPAELQLVSPGEVACLGGRLIAEVPPPAKGFRVRTPRMNVTDLGTVFGVDVGARETELHVFKGSVEFQSPTSAAKQSVLEGHGAIADETAPPRLVPASRSRFASLFDLQNKSSEAEVLRHEQWRAASSRLDEDPTLLVHFDFEQVDLSDWRLPNSSKLKGATPDATIVGCQWTEGRWPDKRALEFRNVSDRVRLEVAGEYHAMTLAAWVRVQGMDRQINSLFMSDGFDAGTVHWSIRDDGVLGLTAIGAEPGRFQICASPPALKLDQFGLWIHLAVVVDGDSKRVVHYLNGVPVSEHTLKIAPPFRIGVAELGNWNARGFPKNDPFMIRNFSGAMDDFCLFSRALSGEGIRELFSVGKPQPESARQSRN
jgi:Concanavalin A-like lectin/glucanases superfamily/FecR protein